MEIEEDPVILRTEIKGENFKQVLIDLDLDHELHGSVLSFRIANVVGLC